MIPESIGVLLREAREKKNLSLVDIASVTNINIEFLRNIEEGNLSRLPQTYVRAFVREYASIVDVDPAELMRRMDTARAEPPALIQPLRPERARPEIQIPEQVQRWMAAHPWFGRGVFVMVALGGLALVLWTTWVDDGTQKPREVSFQEVLRDAEIRMSPGDSVNDAAKPAKDSLFLQATALDTAWLQIIVDSGEPKDYLFYPGNRWTWSGRERFVITLGNAGGVKFVLNKKDLGTLGKAGAVVRNRELSHASLTSK